MASKEYDYLIVGAGLYGACFAYRAKQLGYNVIVVEKRDHIGGNLYCEKIEDINVHKYGAHIFHTSDKEVWDFVNNLVPFNRYTNCPVAKYEKRLFNLPFNMNTFYQIWGVTSPEEAQNVLNEQRRIARDKLAGREPRNLEEQALCLVGQDIYNLLIKGYTEKQWGRPCSELPAFIIRRLPVRLTFDNNYFNDLYQGIPIGGYTPLIEKLLEGIEVRLNVDFNKNRGGELDQWATKIVYTGPIDEFFDFCFGHLQYRTVRFETTIENTPNYQGNAVVNYTKSDIPFTRIIEHKHFESFGEKVFDNPKTVITKEYSMEWHPGIEPFYPINDDKNTSLLKRYQNLANERFNNVIFGGRLAEYKYYDMDAIIKQVLSHPELNK